MPRSHDAFWIGWTKLMARVGEFPRQCPSCGGDIRLIGFSAGPGAIRMIPSYLGEPLEPPPVSPARGPPADWGEIVQVHDERDGFQAAGRRAARDRQSLAVTPTQPTGRCPDAEMIVSAHHRDRLRGADGGEQGIISPCSRCVAGPA